MDKYANYKYFKGEKEEPFEDEGKSFWWKVESYAFNANDEKQKDQLSETMCAYIRERHYQGDTSDANIKWSVALERATEMYLKGIWEGSYLSRKKVSIK